MTARIVLVRGVNVGGHRKLPMAELDSKPDLGRFPGSCTGRNWNTMVKLLAG